MGSKSTKGNIEEDFSPPADSDGTFRCEKAGDITALKSIQGDRLQRFYTHLLVSYKLTPKDANELKRTMCDGDVGRHFTKLTLRGQQSTPYIAYREDVDARVLKAIGDIVLLSNNVTSLDMVGFYAGGRLDCPSVTPSLNVTGVAVRTTVNFLTLAKSRVPGLSFVDLSYNNLSGSGTLSRVSGRAIKSLLTAEGTVDVLDLSNNSIDANFAMHCFGGMIKGIAFLNLSNNPIGGFRDRYDRWNYQQEGFHALQESLSMASMSIHTLILANVSMCPRSAERLAVALKLPTCPIVKLDISFNESLGNTGFGHIIGAVDCVEEFHDAALNTTVYKTVGGNQNLKHIKAQSVGINIAAVEQLVDMFVERPADARGELCVDISCNRLGQEDLDLCDMFAPGKYEFKQIITKERYCRGKTTNKAEVTKFSSSNFLLHACNEDSKLLNPKRWMDIKDGVGRSIYVHNYRNDFTIVTPYKVGNHVAQESIKKKNYKEKMLKEEKQQEKARKDEERLEEERQQEERHRLQVLEDKLHQAELKKRIDDDKKQKAKEYKIRKQEEAKRAKEEKKKRIQEEKEKKQKLKEEIRRANRPFSGGE
jgi:hypothetical protein